MVHRGSRKKTRLRTGFFINSSRFYSRERSLSVKLASICSCFYRSGNFSVYRRTRRETIARAPSLIPMQVEILRKAPTSFPGEMSRLSRVSPHNPFSSTILARTTVPFQPCSIQSLLLLPPPCTFTLLSSRRCPKPSIRFPGSRPPRSYYPFSHSQVSLLAFIVGGSRFSSFYFSISRKMRFSSSFPLWQYWGSVVGVKREGRSGSFGTLSTVSSRNGIRMDERKGEAH